MVLKRRTDRRTNAKTTSMMAGTMPRSNIWVQGKLNRRVLQCTWTKGDHTKPGWLFLRGIGSIDGCQFQSSSINKGCVLWSQRTARMRFYYCSISFDRATAFLIVLVSHVLSDMEHKWNWYRVVFECKMAVNYVSQYQKGPGLASHAEEWVANYVGGHLSLVITIQVYKYSY